MEKVICFGTIPVYNGRRASVFCKIEVTGGRLSISGVEGPKQNGDALGGCGQIVMSIDDQYLASVEYAEGWDRPLLGKLVSVWNRWHLNDMRAGSPTQEEYLRAHPVADRLNYYTAACAVLAAAGLNPDPNYLHDGKPYMYGHAWISEDVPPEVVAFLESLPDAATTPAWV